MTLQKLTSQPFLTALVGLSPAKARHISPTLALQRLNYSSGRTITETAIETEQAWAEARLGLLGRRLSAGVARGLRVGVPDQAEQAGAFTLTSGYGIASEGQDVAVLKPAAISLSQLPELGTSGEATGSPVGLVALVLEPIVIETEKLPQDATARLAFEDPCPPDATTAPYLDMVLQDGVRLSWVALPAGIGGTDTAREANVAAEAIRQIEQTAPQTLPWADAGVPVCLLRVGTAGRIIWHHHAAVARQGGMLPRGGAGQGDSLRQSRLEGLIEETALATRLGGWTGSNAAAILRHLPPAGVLPRKCWDTPGFFPAGWAVAHAPIPHSQLDAALEAARRLAPFDLDATRERAKFLIPVPDEFYAANLLEPIVTPDWAAVRTPLQQAVGDRLALRDAYRAQTRSVMGVIDLQSVPDFSQAEDDPIPGETGFSATAPEPDSFDTDATDDLKRVHDALSDTLFTDTQRAMVDPARLASALPPSTRFGLTPFVTDMRALLSKANDTIDFSFNRVQAEIYRLRQIILDEEEATKLATFPVLAGLAKGSNAYAMSEGIKAQFLAKKADAQIPAGREAAIGVAAPIVLEATRAEGIAVDMSRGRIAPDTLAPIISQSDDLKGSTVLSGFTAESATLAFGVSLGEAALVKGADTTVIKELVDSTRSGLVDDAILADADAKRSGILRAAPLPGDIHDARNATIADRLKASASLMAKASAVRIKADVMRTLQAMGLSLEGLKAPLTSSRDRVLLPQNRIDEVIAKTLTAAEQDELKDEITRLRAPVGDTGPDKWDLMKLPVAQTNAAADAVQLTPMTRLSSALLRETAPFTLDVLPALTLTKQLDPDPGKSTGSDPDLDDEAAYLDSAVAVLEGVIALIRQVEGRVLAITSAVEVAAAELPGLNTLQGNWQQALTAADQDLDEARHDLRVAESLIAEETARLTALAEQRQRILAEEVKFVAYTRPRALTAHRAGDTQGQLLPGAFDDPLPVALKRDVTLPPELATMIGVLREMPIAWFSANPELAASFDDPKYLGALLQNAPPRAKSKKSTARGFSAQKAQSPAMQQVTMVAMAYQAMTLQLYDTRAAADITALDSKSWQEKRRAALALLSLNDLIENSQQPQVARSAATEIEQIERVIHAFWQQSRQVTPSIRLLWAQELSAYDSVTQLSSLAKLPGWSLVPFNLRQRLDRLNGWLFSRMDAGLTEAQGFVTDLVRVALLIAAHAPVAEIVSARVDSAQTAQKGAPVDVTIRRGNPKIGMQVSFLEAGVVKAWGQIADLSGSRARVDIVQTVQPVVQISTAQTVTVYDAGTLVKGA